MTQGIYIISNNKSENVYIGQSKNIEKRIIAHFSHLRNNYHSNKNMQNEFNEFGEHSFNGVLLEEINDENNRKLREKELITSGKYSVYNGISKMVSYEGNSPKLVILEKEITKLKTDLNMLINFIIKDRDIKNKNFAQLTGCVNNLAEAYLFELKIKYPESYEKVKTI